MAGNTAGDFAVTLRASLQTKVTAVTNFASVKVYLTGEGVAALDEAVFLIRPDEPIRARQEHAAFGAGRRNDEFTIPGRLQVKAAGKASDTSATFATAMNRARDLLDLVIAEIKDNPPSVGDQTLRSIVEEITYDPYRIDQGWSVVCDFNIAVTARVS